MSDRRPRTLQFYWEDETSKPAHAAWRSFISAWVEEHGRVWELAELHWLSYVEEFMEYRPFELLSGSKLTRKAEAAAQRLLAILLAAGRSCKYCETMDGQNRGQNA
jgi:hypothetical protein